MSAEFTVWTSSGLAQGTYQSLERAEAFAKELADFHGAEVVRLPEGISIWLAPMGGEPTIYIETLSGLSKRR